MRGSLRERSVVTESHGREQYEGVGRGLLSAQRHDDQATQQENEGVTSNQSCRQARLCFSSYILCSRRSYLWALAHHLRSRGRCVHQLPRSSTQVQWKNREFLRLFRRLSLNSLMCNVHRHCEALLLAAAQQSMSIAIVGLNLFSVRTYSLASATGSGARYAWYHVVSQTSPSNFFQHAHLIALALWYGAALRRCNCES